MYSLLKLQGQDQTSSIMIEILSSTLSNKNTDSWIVSIISI
jgi:hypothetical protein